MKARDCAAAVSDSHLTADPCESRFVMCGGPRMWRCLAPSTRRANLWVPCERASRWKGLPVLRDGLRSNGRTVGRRRVRSFAGRSAAPRWLRKLRYPEPGRASGRTQTERASSGAHFSDLALGARRMPVLIAIAFGEMRQRLKPARRRDIHDGHGSLQQQFAGAPQAHLEIIALRHAIQVALEQTFDLPARQSRRLGDFLERQRPFDVLFHELRHANQSAVGNSDARAQRDVLAIVVLADPIDDELLR